MATYFRDFADADGISDFTERVTVAGQDAPVWSIVSSNQVQATSASSQAEALVWNDIDSDADRDDVEVLCQVYVDVSSATQRWLVGRMATSGTVTGYAPRLRTTSVTLYRFSGGTYTSISDVAVTITSGTWCWLRMRLNGSTVQLRYWADGDSEPGTWNIDTTDATYNTAGYVGLLKGSNTNTQLWRKLGVGTNGDTAPSSAVSSATSIVFARAFPRPILNF